MRRWIGFGAEGLYGKAPWPGPQSSASPSPLSISLYRSLWLATIVANIGTCMKDVGTGWLMTSLTPSPLLVALVQAATMLPMALLSLPGGAMADIVDRRILLLFAKLWGMAAAACLFIATLTGMIDALLLLALTFATACGSALAVPALQAITSELVPRPAIAQAVTLAGISNNIARIVGPAAGGIVIAVAGVEWVFFANAVSVVGILVVLRGWKRRAETNRFPPEHLLGAIRAGFRYAHSSPELHSLLVRSLAFFLCASALWSLLPLVARQELGLGPAGYGLMLASIGVGAITGALSLPRLRRQLSADQLSKGASLLLAVAVAAAGIADDIRVAIVAMVATGFGWNVMTTNLQSVALLGAANWVKARAFGIFLMVFQGSMAIGAVLWGTVALQIGVANSLLAAAALLAAGLLFAALYPLIIDPGRDFDPSRHLPDPVVDQPVAEDEGPVLITIEYQVDPTQSVEFIARLRKMRAVRLRDGAVRWRYWRDVSRRNRIVETFIVDSWLDHMRQHDRFTNADRVLQQDVWELHTGKSPPLVRHWIALP